MSYVIKNKKWKQFFNALSLFVLVFGSPIALLADETITFGATANDDQTYYGETGGAERTAQQFTTSADHTDASIILKFKKYTLPLDNTVIRIQADSAGSPSDVDLYTSSFANSTLSTSCANKTITISSMSLSAGTYWIIFSRDGGNDTTNVPSICLDNAVNTRPFKYRSSGTWNSLGENVVGSITLSGTPAGGGDTSSTTSSTTSGSTATSTAISYTQQFIFNVLLIFIICFILSIWIWKQFMQ